MTLLDGIFFEVSFSGNHPLDPLDDARFVLALAGGGCTEASSAAGGVLGSGLSVGVTLSVGVYELCLAEAPFSSGGETAASGDYDHHPHVTLIVVHEPPSAHPSPPPPQAPPP